MNVTTLRIYYFTALFSFFFAVVGFSYNAWRLEETEDNNNIRTAAFEMLTNLAELEQIIYAAHYDGDKVRGNPRLAWVKVGLIVDLSMLISPDLTRECKTLKQQWRQSWELIDRDRAAVDGVIVAIERVRDELKLVLHNLK